MGAQAGLLLLASLLLASQAVALRPSNLLRASIRDKKEEKGVVAPVKAYRNTKPLIGILTQPCHDCPGKSYIAAGYVKWIESAGGRAVPIRFYATDDELKRLFNSINGLVFPGGLTWLWLDSPYVIAARKLFNMALEANDGGKPFPIWGTCLGFQLLHILAANISRNVLLVDTDSVAHPANLMFTGDAQSSKLFGTIAPDLVPKLADPSVNIALENHMYGIPPSYYKRFPVLAKWYRILSTTKDRNGTEYISTMEAIKYPFFGTQWHPEKPPFEFGMEEVPHSLDAIRVSQHLANVFLEAARGSPHAPQSHEEALAMLIYSTPPVFSARFEVLDEENYDGPDITYYFDQQDKPPHGPDDDEGGDDGPHPTPTHPAQEGEQEESKEEQQEAESGQQQEQEDDERQEQDERDDDDDDEGDDDGQEEEHHRHHRHDDDDGDDEEEGHDGWRDEHQHGHEKKKPCKKHTAQVKDVQQAGKKAKSFWSSQHGMF